jgi:hypothetical protein
LFFGFFALGVFDQANNSGILGFGIVEKIDAPDPEHIPALGLEYERPSDVTVPGPGSQVVGRAVQFDATQVFTGLVLGLDSQVDPPATYSHLGIDFVSVRTEALAKPFLLGRGKILGILAYRAW